MSTSIYEQCWVEHFTSHNNLDLDGVVNSYSEDCVLRVIDYVSKSIRVYNGHAGVRQFFAYHLKSLTLANGKITPYFTSIPSPPTLIGNTLCLNWNANTPSLQYKDCVDSFTFKEVSPGIAKISMHYQNVNLIVLQYDYIVVGLGYAGAIVASRLAERCPDKKILAIEYGGPVQYGTGGATNEKVEIAFTAEVFSDRDGDLLCMPDVPGNYNNVAFRPISDKYHIPEFPACFQGSGLGGNSVYNGALYQEPAEWWWNDKVFKDIFQTDNPFQFMQQYFDRVKETLAGAIKSHPSMDGNHYNHGLYNLVKPFLEKNGFTEIPPDSPQLDDNPRFFTVPTVLSKNGIRSGASAWLEKFIDINGNVKPEFPNVDLLTYSEVKRVLLDSSNTAIGVEITSPSQQKQGGLLPLPQLTTSSKYVTPGGKVILCCNTLPTNRLLYLSGIGCETLRGSVMPGNKTPFLVNNEAIGTAIHEHVTTSIGMKYTGPRDSNPCNAVHFNPGDYVSNIAEVVAYKEKRSGPFCQFGPVVASHFRANMELVKDLPDNFYFLEDDNVTTELFYNPFGIGPYPPHKNPGMNPYNGPDTFSIYVMLLRPEQRGLFRLKADNTTAEYVEVYLSQGAAPWDPTPEQRKALGLPDYRAAAKKDIGAMTASVIEVIQTTLESDHIKLNLGPGDGITNGAYGVVVDNVSIPIKDLDPRNAAQVKGYVTFFDDYFFVDGARLPITHLEENHYNCSAPLSRNLDVFGNDLGDRKDRYGVNPDTLEVRGVKGLCVADSSIFPKVIYCHPIGATMAMAEWAVDVILK